MAASYEPFNVFSHRNDASGIPAALRSMAAEIQLNRTTKKG